MAFQLDNMARFSIVFLALSSITTIYALQVAPNSQCASVCLDDSNQDKSDPGTSNTQGSDVICRDKNYATSIGQKYKKCVECLQSSSDKSQSESDLQWFLCTWIFKVNGMSKPLTCNRQFAILRGKLRIRTT